MKRFCLIGEKLGHSLSQKIHKAFNQYDYSLVELEESQLKDFVDRSEYCGFNVTIPYKQKIMEYIDEIEERAKKIGAVNTVVYKNGKSYGYNTDILGMEELLKKSKIELKDKIVLILGSGGTSHTANYLCKIKEAKEIVIVSRNGKINYSNVKELYSHCDVIINTTPVGMYPNINESPIDLKGFVNLSGVIDVIYNPEKTQLLLQAEMLNINAIGGKLMLAAQAKYGMELFLNKSFSDKYIEIAEKEIVLWMSCVKVMALNLQ